MTVGLTSVRHQEALLRYAILSLTWLLGFSIRLFSVLRYESIIHEFDPWFNFRSTKKLVEEGSYAFWNWFDDRSWYPLGRIVGGTVYPGIMYTAAFMHKILHLAGFKADIREVCVLTAPIWSGLTAIAAYLLTSEVSDSAAGLIAAVSIALVPGYMSRSVAGSYDNEAVAITALIFTFWVFLHAVTTGSTMWAALSSLSYLYMVSTWGGYIFITNIVPIYVLVMVLAGRYSHRLYIAYSVWFVMGTLLSMQIRFVGFNAVQSSEHMGALGVFGLLNLYVFTKWIRSFTSKQTFRGLISLVFMTAGCLSAVAIFYGIVSGYIGPWTGRFYTLLDPTYASKHIPIIASVAEHQPTSWSHYFMDLHIFTFLMPVGLYLLFQKLNDQNIFLIVYGTAAVYFSGVMVRLMLVLAPAAVMLGSVGISDIIKTYCGVLKTTIIPPEAAVPVEESVQQPTPTAARKKPKAKSGQSSQRVSARTSSAPAVTRFRKEIAAAVLLVTFYALFLYIKHSVWTTSEAYSSPSIVLSAKNRRGERVFYDDFREAYYWLRQNTDEDAKILSWWDYGYQLAGMANRTTIVDNNTWNNTHIATVGRVLNAPEEKAYKICRKLDVDYVLVIFGGLLGYSADDINKFLWPVRISASVDPSVNEREYLTREGGYSVGANMGEGLRKSLIYKLSYYRFGEVQLQPGVKGYDRVRNQEIGDKDVKLKHFEEAFTSENWIVRIYRVKEPSLLGWQ
eukprot:Plantae.Rhodophyta-Purpureofilum_apyrenoidigerum.ctg3169.p1 GENE.Plantae.Rhodophyta-Purpureofilum_apyrenoidigerum.ctg3169~~Plantae.Rhodophyta-Purpureofilum_apyrenoidigerum.ctg3169.p1  ORF type:complete len:732 (-),score=118.55 Plantae.Rhodophyta-Purpureofilum_apyrenoidigerum.ctg3169:1090-3285(-)